MRNETLTEQDLTKQLLSLKQNQILENNVQQKLFHEKLMQNELDEKYQKELFNEKFDTFKEEAFEKQQQRTYILIDPIIEDMVEQKIILPHPEDVSFELNNKTFIVNGKKQPAEVHERFKKKYLRKDEDYFKFSRKNGSTTIHLN